MPPPRRASRAKPLAEFLPDTLDPLVARLGMSQATLVLDWAEIVGERLAAICEPARLRWPPRGPKSDPAKAAEPATLMLRVAQGMGLEIQHLAPVLIERVNAHLGWRCVGRIALRAEPFTPKRKTARKPLAVDPRARAEAERLAEGIEDEALKAALTRLGTVALSEKRR
ncbi:MAG TPA: DciA family protein [Rhodoblastus sp.]|nr:DciA family protein [Rhodoblastus sp.]